MLLNNPQLHELGSMLYFYKKISQKKLVVKGLELVVAQFKSRRLTLRSH